MGSSKKKALHTREISCFIIACVLVMMCAFTAMGEASSEQKYVQPDEYPFVGETRDMGYGLTVYLPETATGVWDECQADAETGIVGGVINRQSDISVMIYAGVVSYPCTLDGIFEYVQNSGNTGVRYTECNGTETVQFEMMGSGEKSVAYPWNNYVVQVTVRSKNTQLREQYANWIFSSLQIDSDGVSSSADAAAFEQQNDQGSTSGLTEDQCWQAMNRYIDRAYDMETVTEYHGWFAGEGRVGDELKYHLRSYTAAHVYFYLNPVSGEIWQEEQNPITDQLEPREYVANAYDYLEDAY